MKNIRTTARIAQRLSNQRHLIRYKTFNSNVVVSINRVVNIGSKPAKSNSNFMESMAKSIGLEYVDMRVETSSILLPY